MYFVFKITYTHEKFHLIWLIMLFNFLKDLQVNSFLFNIFSFLKYVWIIIPIFQLYPGIVKNQLIRQPFEWAVSLRTKKNGKIIIRRRQGNLQTNTFIKLSILLICSPFKKGFSCLSFYIFVQCFCKNKNLIHN